MSETSEFQGQLYTTTH